jgi:N-acetylmuramoyl-L-alanine amidase
MSKRDRFLGMIKDGEFRVLAPQPYAGKTMKLTPVKIQESRSPEVMDLSGYENKMVVVNGYGSGEWIYSAEAAEEAGPVMTDFLLNYFSNEEAQKKLCALVIGHQEDSPGAVNKNSNISEFEFNSRLAPLIEKKVKKAKVQLVSRRSLDTLPGDINALDPDFIVSLHCNAFDSIASGTEVLYCYKSKKGKEVAETLLMRLVEHMALRNRGIVPRREGELGYKVLCETKAPAVIAEPFFISSDDDLAKAMGDMEGLAEAYAKAIEEIAETVV